MDRQSEILKAAEHAFLKFGLEKITLDDIAQECGINKTALYYYFRSKEEILAKMILLKMNEFEEQLQNAVKKAETVREKLRTYMSLKISMMKENLPFFKLFENEGLPVKAKKFLEEHRKHLMETDFSLVKGIIEQGIQNKKVSYELNDSLVLMILGVTYGSFIGRFLEEANWDIDEMIDTSIEVIFNGIG